MVVHLTGGGKSSRDMVNMDFWKLNQHWISMIYEYIIYIVLTSFHPQMMIFVIIGLLTGLTMVAGETVKNFHRLIFQNWQHFVAILTTNPNGEVHIGSDIISTCWLTFILVHVDSRDLKTFASSFICTNKLSEYFQMFQIFKNISKHSNTFRSIPKYFPIFQNISKYPQIFPNKPKYSQIFLNIPKYSQI